MVGRKIEKKKEAQLVERTLTFMVVYGSRKKDMARH